MPIPFILGAAALATGAVGVKKGIDAKNDMDLAKSINEEANRIVRKTEKSIEKAKDRTKTFIENLGRKKIELLSTSINDFIINFEKIKNINLKDSDGIDELRNFNPQSSEFKELKKASFEAKEIAVNGLSAIGGGALLAFGTYNIVMGGLGGLLVTATTGTALSSLTGVAATNATLAWLGGGALSAGGFGMVGGMAVLGGIVAGPALAIGGALFAKQAEKAYYDAQSNADKAKEFEEQGKTIVTMLSSISTRANNLRKLLNKLNKYFVNSIEILKYGIETCGTNWNTYPDSMKNNIYICVQIAQTIKVVIDTSLLNEKGELMPESKKALKNGEDFLRRLS
ncbi:hypothetical protein CLOACE_13600 [Clostridium acetireducens DSM 10703]|uniref:Uncharacterized protein n=1 Tax=Clostridium acetireducens DSM 10703 TaxID=1121290 RepID=A0A1E8EYG1_9CLOT|nr:hypothetical protein [Clostridium acetireducens]OFI05979.1 hypothetical protein CLOACE_13600 [Clostridium acetireducens DSM 10703]